ASAGVAIAAVDRAHVRGLDARQIGLEGNALVVQVEAAAGARARKDDRRRVIGVAVRPEVQVGHAVEAGVRVLTSRDLYQQGRRGVEAVVVVTVGLLDVVGRTFGA